MIPVAPYLLRAYHQWMEDSELSAHILVDCTYPGVSVPSGFIQQDKIVLNIAIKATNALIINNDAITFKAKFSGESVNIFVPIKAILSIYSGENGEGMFFENAQKEKQPKAKKPKLTLLD
jgi:stringent starvation protein B